MNLFKKNRLKPKLIFGSVLNVTTLSIIGIFVFLSSYNISKKITYQKESLHVFSELSENIFTEFLMMTVDLKGAFYLPSEYLRVERIKAARNHLKLTRKHYEDILQDRFEYFYNITVNVSGHSEKKQEKPDKQKNKISIGLILKELSKLFPEIEAQVEHSDNLSKKLLNSIRNKYTVARNVSKFFFKDEIQELFIDDKASVTLANQLSRNMLPLNAAGNNIRWIKKYHKKFKKSIKAMESVLKSKTGIHNDDINKLQRMLYHMDNSFSELTTSIEEVNTLSDSLNVNILEAKNYLNLLRIATKAREQSFINGLGNDSVSNRNIVIVCILIGVFIIFMIGFLLRRSITKTLHITVSEISERRTHILNSSDRIVSIRNQILHVANELASGIYESSSILKHMQSKIEQNADHSSKADLLMKETLQVVNNANDTVDELNSSMNEVTKQSEETAKIIKTIDNIAFQTNILALNAAVEAARAGEAGAGFAVVADEVRNLAMRTADASKNTGELIEKTVEKIKSGFDLVIQANDAFAHVAESATRVGNIISQISDASRDQKLKIEHLADSNEQIEKLSNVNNENAEELASCSELMNSQGRDMEDTIEHMAIMIDLKIDKNTIAQ